MLSNELSCAVLTVNIQCNLRINIFLKAKKIANCCENVAKICAKKTNAPEIPKRTLSKINSKILIRDFIRKTSQIGKEINV